MNRTLAPTAMKGRSRSAHDAMARGLGYFSLALGVTELFAARALCRSLGMEGSENLIKAYGAREVATVERLTGVRIDHVVIVDFEGFKDITDELGGVTVNVARATSDERGTWKAGPQAMDGETALNYVRQRHNLPGGDFDRVKRQQNWIRAVALKTLDRGTLTSPAKLSGVLGSLTGSIAADDGFTIGRMRSLALSLRGVRGGDLTFLTAPVAGTGWSPDHTQSIVNLDRSANRRLWKAAALDRLDEWLAAHPEARLGRSVR